MKLFVNLIDIKDEILSGKIHLLDVRNANDFISEHIRGSISLPYSEKGLVDRVRIVLSEPNDVVIVVDDEEQALILKKQFTSTHYRIIGFVKDILDAVKETNLLISDIQQISVKSLIKSKNMIVLDVRESMEWETGYYPGAILQQLSSIKNDLTQIPSDVELAVICEAGIRSLTAVSLLKKNGYKQLFNVVEGTAGYRKSGEKLEFYKK
jgi:hydroxyacylglutathione hydrolase